MNPRGFDDFLRLRTRLAGAMERLAGAYERLGASERSRQLLEARSHLASDQFRLMVVGEFKRGKSTLVNALLGQDILPAKVAPCTAVITEVKYGELPAATLFYRDPTQEPLEIALDQLRHYVVIESEDDDDAPAEAAVAASPYSHIALNYPLGLCRNNVTIIDSPGLNEHNTRTKIALDYMAASDAVVLVLSCQQALSQSELAFIDRDLSGRNLRHVFFVWNHHDAIADSPTDREDLRQRSAKYLESRVGSDARIYFLSARDALLGRKAGDDAAVTAAGLTALEQGLENFLATDRGRVKLLTPLRMAESAIRDGLAELLPAKGRMLEQPLAELKERYERERPRLEAIERQRERLVRSIERRRDALIAESQAAYQRFIALTETALRAEVARIPVGTWEAIISQRRVQEQIGRQLQTWFDQRVTDWQTSELDPLFGQHVRLLEAELEDQSRDFVASVEAVRAALAPDLRVGVSAFVSDVAAVDRLLSAVGGFFLGGVGAAIEGASLGFRGMSRGLVIHIGIGIGLVALGLGMPVVFPILAAVGVGRSLWEANQVVDRLRERVASEISGQLRDRLPVVHQEIAQRITHEFDGLIRAMDTAMAIMVDEVVGQVQTILRAKQDGEIQLAEAQAALAAVRAELVASAKILDTIRFEVEG